MPTPSPLTTYIEKSISSRTTPNPGFIAYLASLEEVSRVSPKVSRAIVSELRDQRRNLKMIASENYSSLSVQLAQGNLFTDKYAEGYPEHRFYAGCENVDTVEGLAVSLACRLFGTDHAYVQPHSGADANLIAYWAILSARIQTPFMNKFANSDLSALSDDDWKKLRTALGNQRLLGMDYYSGGHLTHGYRHNVSSRMFDVQSYTVDKETHLIDYDAVRIQAKTFNPLILLVGYSAYSRKINFKVFKEIADEVGSVLMVDMAHFSGLVAGKVFAGENDPVPYADILTTTTHKTLRGPRGGMILCRKEFAEYVDRGCPMVLGGPLPHAMAAKAIGLQEASTNEFKNYAHRIVENASALAKHSINMGINVITGGTDNHLMLIDVTPFGLTGRQAESALREAHITLNRNSLPFDINGPWYTSGLRLGTPALTTLGMGVYEMKEIASVLKLILANTKPVKITKGKNSGLMSKSRYHLDPSVLKRARSQVCEILNNHPLYPELDFDFLEKSFFEGPVMAQ